MTYRVFCLTLYHDEYQVLGRGACNIEDLFSNYKNKNHLCLVYAVVER